MTHSAPLWEGLTEQWPNVGCTQEHLLDPDAARALTLGPGASLPQKKFTQLCRSSVSGIMENHNTHLAPGFTPNDLVSAQRMWFFSRVHWGLCLWGMRAHSLYQMSFQQGNRLSPCGLKTLGLQGIRPSHQSTTRYQAAEFQTLCSPCL